jgi:Kef-type K+ transport system membrane component KefB
MLSVELGVTVALIELTLGVVVGNVFHLHTAGWLDFIAKFASIVLTFAFAGLVSYFVLDWTPKASLIAGTALSTTSLAVVYSVLVERGLNTSNVGKLLMSATFVTDLCTAVALSAIFIKPNVWFPVFVVVSIALILTLPKLAHIIDRTQFSLLITVVVLSAVLPTAIAERWFLPDEETRDADRRTSAVPAEEFV